VDEDGRERRGQQGKEKALGREEDAAGEGWEWRIESVTNARTFTNTALSGSSTALNTLIPLAVQNRAG
jgi:hypothetical protein